MGNSLDLLLMKFIFNLNMMTLILLCHSLSVRAVHFTYNSSKNVDSDKETCHERCSEKV